MQKETANNAAPKKRGRKLDGASKSGRIRELLATGMTAADIATKVGCTVGLVYNVKARASGSTSRSTGKPTRRAAAAPADLDGIIAAVQASERETAAMRAALERIRALIDGALQ